mgnify:FL=1
MKFPRRGLYAITQTEHKSSSQILNEVELALKSGVAVLQYRDKQPLDALNLAQQLSRLCQQYSVPLIINDDVDLALKVGADGVHLGRDDASFDIARMRLGPEAIIGVSCYNDLKKAVLMAERGADYVAFGRFYPSGTKPLAAPADIATLTLARQVLNIPIVAIGGIIPENAQLLVDAGADLIAVVGGIFNDNPEKSVQNYFNSLNFDLDQIQPVQ